MDNYYTSNPLKVLITNPYTSKVIKCTSIPSTVTGGVHRSSRDIIQMTDFSILDTPSDELKEEPILDEIEVSGSPSSVMVYPEDTIAELRLKLYVALGIPPYRQYLLLTNNKGMISTVFNVYVGQDMIETNIFSSLQNISENSIMNIPFDLELYNNKDNTTVEMYDTFISLMVSPTVFISRIIVCDLFTIINPQNQELINVLKNSMYQKELLYYGFVQKFYPILPLNAFEQIYLQQDNISYIYPYLSPSFTKVKEKYYQQKNMINHIYEYMNKGLAYMKSVTNRRHYSILKIEATVKIPNINTRNLFDLFILDKEYVCSFFKLPINGQIYLISKKYALLNTYPDINLNKYESSTLIILTNDNTEINIQKSTITIKQKFEENAYMNFDQVSKNISKIILNIINHINNLGVVVLEEGDMIELNILDIHITTCDIIVFWPDNYSSDQFIQLKSFLERYENIGFLTIFQSTLGSHECIVNTGIQNINNRKKEMLLQQFPNIYNQYDYYTNSEFRSRWNDITRKIVTFVQKTSHTAIILTGGNENTFNKLFHMLVSLMYIFNDTLSNKRLRIDPVMERKNLRKLKGVDPELYDIKRHDPSYQVYSIKCQSNRQPVIYKAQELKYLSQTLKNRLIKFWNFTESRPVFYDCPNKKYPHLSFRPQDHPLGYCLPCCKKLVPSAESRQAKIDEVCLTNLQLPHKEIDEIIKKMEKDYTHLLSYGKEIAIGRLSRIPPIIEDNIFLKKTNYKLVGVKQFLPNFSDAGFIYSILYCLKVDLNTFTKDILQIVNEGTFQMLDGTNTLYFDSYHQLKDTFINLFVEKNRDTLYPNSIHIDWINIICELVYLAYGYHIIIFTDYDRDVKLRIMNNAQICILQKQCNDDYIVIVAHDDGTYPLIEQNEKFEKTVFTKEDLIINAVFEILETENQKVTNLGTSLNDIFNFINKFREYTLDLLLRGKRGLIYGVILTDKHKQQIYVPCIYSEYIDSRYKTSSTFPDMNNLKRSVLYNFVDDFNAHTAQILIDNKIDIRYYIDPDAVLKYKDSYIGFKIRYLNNKFGTTFYHAPEKTAGRYNINIINVRYSLESINKAIMQQSQHIIDPKVGTYTYNNYIYTLFLLEFATETRKHKNSKVRKKLYELFSKKNQVDRRILRDILKDYPNDYKTIIKLLTVHHHNKVHNLIKDIMFSFDLHFLEDLKKLNIKERIEKIKHTMMSYVTFQKQTPDISNILSTCGTGTDFEQCSKSKLIIDQENFDKCTQFLARDLAIPYLYETISLKITDIRDQFKFTKRNEEILSIQQID